MIDRDRRPFNGYVRYDLAKFTLAVQFYLNRHFTFGKFDLYSGFAFGQGKFFTDNRYVENKIREGYNNMDVSVNTVNTFTSTLMCGLNYRIAKNLSLNFEVAGNYVVPYNMKQDRFLHFYTIPITAGIRYKILP